MNHSGDDTTGVSSRAENELGLKIREAFRHARKALQGGRTALRLLRTTQSKSYRASAVHSLGSIWTNRKDLESELRSYAFLQSFDPVVNNLIEDANAQHSNIFSIDGERTTSVLEASSWVGEWGAQLLEAVSELINMQVSFNDAYLEISVHTPEGGLDNLEQSIDHLQLLITRWETVALGSLEGFAAAANDPFQQADDGDGLFENDRILVWGGVRFTLTTNQAVIFRLLVDAYPGDVTDGTFGDRGIGVLRDSFRFNNAQGKKENYPCRGLITGGSVRDSKRLIDPSIVRIDQEKFSNPQHNPQQSPG